MSYINNFFQAYNYVDSFEKDKEFFDSWTKEHTDYIIHYKKGLNAEIFTVNEKKQYHIVWDTSFWDLFLKYLYIVDEYNFSEILDENIFVENSGYILSIFFKYFSSRYKFASEFSKNFSENAIRLGYKVLLSNLYGNKGEKTNYNFPLMVSKMFVFWHEVAHAEFSKYRFENYFYSKQVQQVYDVLDNCLDLPESSIHPTIKQKIKSRTLSDKLIEELAADLRAFQRILMFESLLDNKSHVTLFIETVTMLIDFVLTKTILETQFDIYILKREASINDLIEAQIIRRDLFPLLTYVNYGIEKLDKSFIFDLSKKRDNSFLFCKMLYIIGANESYAKYIFEDSIYFSSRNFDEISLIIGGLNYLYNHMSGLTVNRSSKRLKYLFNIAHQVQHSDSPMDSIPLFHQYIHEAQKKENISTRYIADAYSRIARVYAENGFYIRAEIFLNNAAFIADKLPKVDFSSAFLLNNIGNVFQLLGEYKMSYKYYLLSLEQRLKYGDTNSKSTAMVYYNLGETLYCQQNFYDALKNTLKSYQILVYCCNKDSEEYKNLEKALKRYTLCYTNVTKVNFPITTPLSELKAEYECNPHCTITLENYLMCIARDIPSSSFEEGCNLYINLVEIVENNSSNKSLFRFVIYAFINFLYLLRNNSFDSH